MISTTYTRSQTRTSTTSQITLAILALSRMASSKQVAFLLGLLSASCASPISRRSSTASMLHRQETVDSTLCDNANLATTEGQAAHRIQAHAVRLTVKVLAERLAFGATMVSANTLINTSAVMARTISSMISHPTPSLAPTIFVWLW